MGPSGEKLQSTRVIGRSKESYKLASQSLIS